MRPDNVGLGGFDSHALPPRTLLTLSLVACVVLGPLRADAQARVAPVGIAVQVDSTKPPLSPKQAFLYSLMLPGLAQAKLDRPLVGAGFFLVEALSLALIHRTTDDLRLAKAYQRDSIPLRYATDAATGAPQLDSKGNPVVAEWDKSYYTAGLVRTRQLQLEDWKAVLIFNHLIAGAEAFVGAQLWDLPQHVKLRAAPLSRGGFTLSATIAR
jgi:hypothetical protein